MSEGEKRKQGIRAAVSLIVEYEGAEALVQDYTQNLSTGGAFVHTDRPMEIGDTVSLQLSFPSLLQPIAIAGTVRWLRSLSETDNGVGIEFTNFDDDARARLDAVLEHILDKDPEYVHRTLRVLLVEDNPYVARLIEEGLGPDRFEEATLEFTSVSNGKDALDALMADIFDVLVIDVNIPLVDGATVISRLRQMERYKNLPVIAVSAGGQKAADEAMNAGADFFLAKPMRLRQIVATMQRLLDLAS